MSESVPRNNSYEAGLAFQRQDETDPVRGRVMKLQRSVAAAATDSFARSIDNPSEGALYEEYLALQHSYPEQFGDSTWTSEQCRVAAKRHRLYNYFIGSSPSDKTDLFDGEGEQSLAKKLRELAQKYNIDTGGV